MSILVFGKLDDRLSELFSKMYIVSEVVAHFEKLAYSVLKPGVQEYTSIVIGALLHLECEMICQLDLMALLANQIRNVDLLERESVHQAIDPILRVLFSSSVH